MGKPYTYHAGNNEHDTWEIECAVGACRCVEDARRLLRFAIHHAVAGKKTPGNSRWLVFLNVILAEVESLPISY